MKIDNVQESKLKEALPEWAVKPNPMNAKMSVINPMAVIDRLNEVFGIGQWEFKTDFLGVHEAKMGSKDAFAGMCKGTLIIEQYGIHLEQYGGSTNMDRGDALKGSATDALTKIASYLGIGAAIYKNMGNVSQLPDMSTEEALKKLSTCTTLAELKTVYTSLSKTLQTDVEVVALKDEIKNKLTV